MPRVVDIVRQVAPKARAEYLEAFAQGDELLLKAEINTPQRLAHFLAQCLHETGGFTITRESGAYSAGRLFEIFGVGHHSAEVTRGEAQRLAGNGPEIFERVYGLGNPGKAKELGNTEPGDGWKYRGGGILQTTGRGNYRRMGAKCGVDFEAKPELVCSSEHALKPALAEWTEGQLNSRADADDMTAITRKINGAYNGLADRENWLKKVRPLCEGVTFSPSRPAVPKTEAAVVVASTVTTAATAKASGQDNSSIVGYAVIAAIVAVVAIVILRNIKK